MSISSAVVTILFVRAPLHSSTLPPGHHGDTGASMADIVLPAAAYTEKTAVYANTEGRAQEVHLAVAPPGMGREDWRIFRAISEVVGYPLPYDTVAQLRARIDEISPALTQLNSVQSACLEASALTGKVSRTQ